MSLPLAGPTATTILLVDGNDNDRTYYADRIRFALPDAIVLEATNGQSGVYLYKSRNIDCIVTEVHLPDMSGFGLLVRLIPRVSRPEIGFIMLTQISSWRGLADLAMRNGVHAFLLKRATAGDDLVRVIQKAIATVGSTRKDRPE